MRSVLERNARFYVAAFLGWTAMALFFFSQGIVQKAATHDPTPWWHHLSGWLIGVYLLAAFTPGILWLGRRFPLESKRWRSRALIHFAFSVAFSVAHLGIESILLPNLGLFPTIMPTVAA